MKDKIELGFKSVLIALLCLLILGTGCAAGKSTTTNGGDQYYEVKKGDMQITVSSDGTLSMPNHFDLHFGTTGTVREILVEEGDRVNQGAILAFMDNTLQKNAVRTALFNLYSAVYTNAPSLLADPATVDY